MNPHCVDEISHAYIINSQAFILSSVLYIKVGKQQALSSIQQKDVSFFF